MSPPLAGTLLHGPGAGARYNSAVRRIEAVVFDIGGVVQESPLHAIARYEQEHGIEPNAINRVVVAAGEQGAWGRPERGGAAGEEVPAALQGGRRGPGHQGGRRRLLATDHR